MFEFNKDRALILFKNEIRAQREGKFSDLDVQFMRAVETNDTTKQAEIVTQKQALRDLTDITTSQFETQSDLIGLWPENILGECPFK